MARHRLYGLNCWCPHEGAPKILLSDTSTLRRRQRRGLVTNDVSNGCGDSAPWTITTEDAVSWPITGIHPFIFVVSFENSNSANRAWTYCRYPGWEDGKTERSQIRQNEREGTSPEKDQDTKTRAHPKTTDCDRYTGYRTS